jgi:hypothetical protein
VTRDCATQTAAAGVGQLTHAYTYMPQEAAAVARE